MKKIFPCFFLNVIICNEILPRYSIAQDYPFMEQYYSKEEGNKPACGNVSCPKSRLMVVQIELLLNSFNNELNDFAERKNLSNAYKLHWNKVLAEVAQNKSGKCLPATYENGSKIFFLYDNKSQSVLEVPSDSNVTLEVVIGERNMSHSDAEEMDKAYFTSKMVQDYTALFFSSLIDLTSRALNNIMGCGYVYTEEDNIVKDRLLCIFGFMYVGQHTLVAQYGTPCSKCDDFYQKNSKTTNGTTAVRKATWNCDQSFPYLCTDLNLVFEPIEAGSGIPNCSLNFTEEITTTTITTTTITTTTITTTITTTTVNMSIIEVETDIPEVPVVSEWPCLPILIPLSILIIIFLVLAIYHLVTALKFRYYT